MMMNQTRDRAAIDDSRHKDTRSDISVAYAAEIADSGVLACVALFLALYLIACLKTRISRRMKERQAQQAASDAATYCPSVPCTDGENDSDADRAATPGGRSPVPTLSLRDLQPADAPDGTAPTPPPAGPCFKQDSFAFPAGSHGTPSAAASGSPLLLRATHLAESDSSTERDVISYGQRTWTPSMQHQRSFRDPLVTPVASPAPPNRAPTTSPTALVSNVFGATLLREFLINTSLMAAICTFSFAQAAAAVWVVVVLVRRGSDHGGGVWMSNPWLDFVPCLSVGLIIVMNRKIATCGLAVVMRQLRMTVDLCPIRAKVELITGLLALVLFAVNIARCVIFSCYANAHQKLVKWDWVVPMFCGTLIAANGWVSLRLFFGLLPNTLSRLRPFVDTTCPTVRGYGATSSTGENAGSRATNPGDDHHHQSSRFQQTSVRGPELGAALRQGDIARGASAEDDSDGQSRLLKVALLVGLSALAHGIMLALTAVFSRSHREHHAIDIMLPSSSLVRVASLCAFVYYLLPRKAEYGDIDAAFTLPNITSHNTDSTTRSEGHYRVRNSRDAMASLDRRASTQVPQVASACDALDQQLVTEGVESQNSGARGSSNASGADTAA